MNIVIPCFTDITRIGRLINCLNIQKGIELENFKIHAFIDYSAESLTTESFILANLDKRYALKTIKRQNLYGLKKNILGAVSETFQDTKEQHIILLEDDLLLSEYALYYCLQSVNLMLPQNVFGISLYAQLKNEWNCFHLHFSDEENFFLCGFPASLGSILSRTHWMKFTQTLNENLEYLPHKILDFALPPQILKWNRKKSWKRELSAYCMDNHFFYLYPKISHSAHLGNSGTNVKSANNAHFNTTLLSEKPMINHINWKKITTLDIFFEPLPNSFLHSFGLEVAESLVVDLYGLKDIKNSNKYVLTSKNGKNPLHSYGYEFQHLAANVLFEIPGEVFFLFAPQTPLEPKNMFATFFEGNNTPSIKRQLTKYLIKKVSQKIKLGIRFKQVFIFR